MRTTLPFLCSFSDAPCCRRTRKSRPGRQKQKQKRGRSGRGECLYIQELPNEQPTNLVSPVSNLSEILLSYIMLHDFNCWRLIVIYQWSYPLKPSGQGNTLWGPDALPCSGRDDYRFCVKGRDLPLWPHRQEKAFSFPRIFLISWSILIKIALAIRSFLM